MNQTVISELLDRKEAAEYLRICRTTLDHLAISRIKIRRRVLCRKSELDKWINNHSQIKGVQK